jgi:hypothetical protein
MKARIGIAASLHWDGIVQFIDVIAMMSALGVIGGLPALLNALTKYTRVAIGRSPARATPKTARSAYNPAAGVHQPNTHQLANGQ